MIVITHCPSLLHFDWPEIIHAALRLMMEKLQIIRGIRNCIDKLYKIENWFLDFEFQ